MDAFRSGLAARIKEARKKAGVRQSELAEACGVEINTISRYETGASAPSIEQLITISKALGISAISLVSPLNHDPEQTEQIPTKPALENENDQFSEIAHRIRQQRQLLGIKQLALAELVGISNSTLSSYEKGSTVPSVEHLFNLSKALQLPVEELAPSLSFGKSSISDARSLITKRLTLIKKENSFILLNDFIDRLIEEESQELEKI